MHVVGLFQSDVRLRCCARQLESKTGLANDVLSHYYLAHHAFSKSNYLEATFYRKKCAQDDPREGQVKFGCKIDAPNNAQY